MPRYIVVQISTHIGRTETQGKWAVYDREFKEFCRAMFGSPDVAVTDSERHAQRAADIWNEADKLEKINKGVRYNAKG